jgi:hypothetical protein
MRLPSAMSQLDQLVADGRSQPPIHHLVASSNVRHLAWSIVSKQDFSILRNSDRGGVTECGRFAQSRKAITARCGTVTGVSRLLSK